VFLYSIDRQHVLAHRRLRFYQQASAGVCDIRPELPNAWRLSKSSAEYFCCLIPQLERSAGIIKNAEHGAGCARGTEQLKAQQINSKIEEPTHRCGAKQTLGLFPAAVKRPHRYRVIHAKESGFDLVVGADDQQPVFIQGFGNAWKCI
jgi:hypothetical protein